MRLYHFADRKFGLDDIRRRRLKIATLLDLNDPFELRGVELPDKARRRAFELFRDDFSRRFGILCFSQNWNSPVQWSHYGERHFGLCLGFDVRDDLVAPVNYRSHLHPENLISDIEAGDENSALEAMMSLLTTKYYHWRYEREFRIFVRLVDPDEENGLFFKEFSDEMRLREAIVGHRSTITRAELSDALGDLSDNVRCKKTRLAFKSFNVVRQKKESIWP